MTCIYYFRSFQLRIIYTTADRDHDWVTSADRIHAYITFPSGGRSSGANGTMSFIITAPTMYCIYY